MTKLEAILEQASGLSAVELEELLRVLSAQLFVDGNDDESAAGMRGLEALTESTRGEDWSMFYPDELRNGGRNIF